MQNNSKTLKDLEQSAETKRLEKESLLLETQAESLKQYHNALAKLFKKEASSIKSSIQSRSRMLEYKLLSLIVLISLIVGAVGTHYMTKSRYHLVPKSWTLEYIEGTTTPYYIKRGN